MLNYDWPVTFRNLFNRAVERYRSGNRAPGSLFNEEDNRFLASIGARPQEIFDFVEDFTRGGEPEFETVLLITAVRRDYFFEVQHGKFSAGTIDMETLPAKKAELAGIQWLPRIIEKAKAKLRGEMPDELMFGCGGDRPFLRSVNVEPADFLKVVWRAGENTQEVVDYVLKARDAHKS